MTGATVAAPARPRVGVVIVPLLALAVFINYIDRGNLATAAPLLKDELSLTSTQIGILTSAFYWTYVPSHALSGWLTEKINPYRTLAFALALWALATFLTGFATVVLLQIVEPSRSPARWRQTLAVHLRNGLYANAAYDRLVGALRTAPAPAAVALPSAGAVAASPRPTPEHMESTWN